MNLQSLIFEFHFLCIITHVPHLALAPVPKALHKGE